MKPLKFNPDCVSRDAGFCYLIEFSDGTLKAGKTIDLLVRYRQHQSDAKREGKQVIQIAHSKQHESYELTERRMIDLLSSIGNRVKDEYFYGVNFDHALAAIVEDITPLLVSSSVEKEGKYNNHKMVSLRLEDYEEAAIREAARADHLPLSTWIKQAAFRAAASQKIGDKKDKSPPVLQENAE